MTNRNNSISGFITNLGKYNEGYLIGEWIDFPITDEDLAAALESIGEVNEIAEKIEEYGEIAEAVVEAFGVDDLMDNDPDDYIIWSTEDNYDLGEAVAEETGVLENIPGELRSYFNFTAYGRDYALEAYGGWCADGYIEYIG